MNALQVATRSIHQLEDEIAEMAAHLDSATHRLLTCIREFDARGGWAFTGARSCADWLSWRIGLDPGTAREKVRVARALGTLPRIDDALRQGKLSYAKVRAMTRIATTEMEERLLEIALNATGSELERICRGYRRVTDPNESVPDELPSRYVRKEGMENGMVRITAMLHPDEAALIMENLVLLCSFHHRLVHEGGFAVRMHARSHLVFHQPDGTELPERPEVISVTDDASKQLRRRNIDGGVVLDGETNSIGWNAAKRGSVK